MDAFFEPTNAGAKRRRLDPKARYNGPNLGDLPNEMIHAVLLQVRRWSDLEVCFRASPTFRRVFTQQELWLRHYAPDQCDIVMDQHEAEPLEAYRLVYHTYGLAVCGFSIAGFLHAARSGGPVELVEWLDGMLQCLTPSIPPLAWGEMSAFHAIKVDYVLPMLSFRQIDVSLLPRAAPTENRKQPENASKDAPSVGQEPTREHEDRWMTRESFEASLAAALELGSIRRTNGAYDYPPRALAGSTHGNDPAVVRLIGVGLVWARLDAFTWALEKGHTDIVTYFIQKWPHYVMAAAPLAYYAAARSDRLDAMRVLHDAHRRFTGNPHHACEMGEPGSTALRCGSRDVLCYLGESRCPSAFDVERSSDIGAIVRAHVERGVYGSVAWLLCDQPKHVCARVKAACDKRMQAWVKKSIANGNVVCALNMFRAGLARCTPSMLTAAIAGGMQRSIQMLEYATTVPEGTKSGLARVPTWRTAKLAETAARSGCVDVLEWLSERFPDTVTPAAGYAAVESLQPSAIDWLATHGALAFAPASAFPMSHVAATMLRNKGVAAPPSSTVIRLLTILHKHGAAYRPAILDALLYLRMDDSIERLYSLYGPPLPSLREPCSLGSATLLPPPLTMDALMEALAGTTHVATIRNVCGRIKAIVRCKVKEAMLAKGVSQQRVNYVGQCTCIRCTSAQGTKRTKANQTTRITDYYRLVPSFPES